jgi:hypothetical protein
MPGLSHADSRRPELSRVREQGERLPGGTSILVIGGMSALSWVMLLSIVMALWSSI